MVARFGWHFAGLRITSYFALSTSFAIICPDYPPRRGGVSDYVALLLARLAQQADVTLITSENTDVPTAPTKVRYIRNWADENELYACLDRQPPPTVLLWNYVPHMYGRGGVAPVIPAVINRLRNPRHLKQIVLGHEIAAPFSLWPHRSWYAWQHRQQWCSILRSADHVVTSTEAWRDEWKGRLPQFAAKLSYAASPSTIPVVPLADAATHRRDWRKSFGWPEETLVLGWFGTASAAKQLEWILAARAHAEKSFQKLVAVILIGKAEELANAQNSPWIKSTGYLEAKAVSHVLQSIDLLLLPFIDGASERRTSFMAGLSHGTPVISTVGHNTGPTLKASDICRLVSATAPGEFNQAVAQLLMNREDRLAMGLRGRAYYEQHYDWPIVTEHFLSLARQEVQRV